MNTKAHKERISVHQQLHVLTEMFNQLGTVEPLQGQDIRVGDGDAEHIFPFSSCMYV